jgi:hypothetical protein
VADPENFAKKIQVSVLIIVMYHLFSTLAGISDETIVLSTVMLCYNCIFESRDRR